MPTLEPYEFLQMNEEKQLRKRIANVLSSYSLYSDILAEVLQNAVDAVDERYHDSPEDTITRIHIEFNVKDRKIVVTDTGIGMPWEMLKKAPSPDTSFKDDKLLGTRRSRGEKGAGLAFLTFSCNRLYVKTCNGAETISAEINDANNWAHDRLGATKPRISPEHPEPQPASELLGSSKFTQIEMEDIRTEDYSQRDIFEVSESELIYIIRTKTALGHVGPVISAEEPEPSIQITLEYIDEQGDRSEVEIPYRYLSPEEYLTEGSKIAFDEFQKLQAQSKLHKAQGKALIYRHSFQSQSGKTIKCYAFSMAVKAFEDITQDRRIEGEYAPDDWSGIYIATRGMPTGIKIEPPTSSGYWRRVFVLLEDDEMKFDVGRKTLQGRAKPMMQEMANEVWNDIQSYLLALTPAPSEPIIRAQNKTRQKLFDEAINGWPNLDLPSIQYAKEPQREQMVVALFYELVGARILEGYQTLRNNGRDQYDGFVQYRIKKTELGALMRSGVSGDYLEDNIIIEFKHSAYQVIRDITENKKDYRDIDLLICWDVSEAQMESAGIDVSVIPDEAIYFFGSTHKLYFPGIYPMKQDLTVMELKTVVSTLIEND